MKYKEIVSDEDILGGEPVFSGTRLSIRMIKNRLEHGESKESILNDYPYLTKDDLVLALSFEDEPKNNRQKYLDGKISREEFLTGPFDLSTEELSYFLPPQLKGIRPINEILRAPPKFRPPEVKNLPRTNKLTIIPPPLKQRNSFLEKLKNLLKYVFFFLLLNCNNQENIVHEQQQNQIYALQINVNKNICPDNMVEVEGNYCPVVEEICLRWLDEDQSPKANGGMGPLRCAEFKHPTKCLSARTHMHFCMDRYEYPNVKGEKPSLQNTWYRAKEKCESMGKRLCYENEWTQTCRGPNDFPYPYGYIRDSSICRIDLPWQDPTTHSFEELDKTIPSGSMEKCVSPYGVYDMVGNADEWTISPGGTRYKSVLKGGHPHGVRNRCTSATTAHNENFSFYVTGFRCCKNIMN